MSGADARSLDGISRALAARRMQAEARAAGARAGLELAERVLVALEEQLRSLTPAADPGDAGRLAVWQADLIARRDAACADVARARAAQQALARALAVEQAREEAAAELAARLRAGARTAAERRAEDAPQPVAGPLQDGSSSRREGA